MSFSYIGRYGPGGDSERIQQGLTREIDPRVAVGRAEPVIALAIEDMGPGQWLDTRARFGAARIQGALLMSFLVLLREVIHVPVPCCSRAGELLVGQDVIVGEG